MKILLLTITLFLSACASKNTVPPLISKKNCTQTCMAKGMEMKDYDEEKGCYCGPYDD